MRSVRHFDSIPAEAVAAGTGTSCQVLIGPDEAPNFALRRFVMEPGGGMPTHTNSVEHVQYVLQGRARIVIEGESCEVGPGDAVFIPAGAPHSYRNAGSERFVFLCAVPNRPDRVEVIENEGRSP